MGQTHVLKVSTQNNLPKVLTKCVCFWNHLYKVKNDICFVRHSTTLKWLAVSLVLPFLMILKLQMCSFKIQMNSRTKHQKRQLQMQWFLSLKLWVISFTKRYKNISIRSGSWQSGDPLLTCFALVPAQNHQESSLQV